MDQVITSPAGITHLIRYPMVARITACGLDSKPWGDLRAYIEREEVLCERCLLSAVRHGFVIPYRRDRQKGSKMAGFHRWHVFYGIVIDIDYNVLKVIATKEIQDAARTVDVLIRVGDQEREMSIAEFLQAIGFPNDS